MDINFLNPLFLILLPIFVFIVVIIGIKKIKRGFARGVYTFMRVLIIALLVFALAGASFGFSAEKTAHIFVIDKSASVLNSSVDVRKFVDDTLKFRSPDDQFGAVIFGGNALVDARVSPESLILESGGKVEDGNTGIADGLRYAATIFPENMKKHIILLSDGNENVGDAVSEAKILKNKRIVVSALSLERGEKDELMLSALKTPKILKKGDKYSIEVEIFSTYETDGRLLIRKNNGIIVDKVVNIKTGDNNFSFSDTANKSDVSTYKAEIREINDTMPENKAAYSYSVTQGAPNILIVENGGSGVQIKKILKKSKVSTTTQDVSVVNSDINHFAKYDGIILANVSLDFVPENFAANLESYVKNLGGGVVVAGGEDAFGLGEYKDTPLELLLPVNMELKDKQKLPDMGMIVVLDRSGSMEAGEFGISKLELAKEAVIRSVDALNDKDSFGALTFDDKFEWAHGFSKVEGAKETIINNIGKITSGGGTSILPALNAAYEEISKQNTKVKHIILLTDGQAETSGYDAVIEKMNAEGITLSTVAVGEGSDTRLLSKLARTGGGRYYYSDEFSDIPKIFAKETKIAGKAFLVNEKFAPLVSDASAILVGVEGVPNIYGYVATTKKDRADVVLESPKKDPVLATWQYGLGRSVAWTSDLNGLWSEEWLASEEGVSIIKNAVSYAIRKQMLSDIDILASTNGDKTALTINFPIGENVLGVVGTVVSSDLEKFEVGFKQISPGVFYGELPTNKEGAYIANLELEKKSGKESFVSGINVPYSSEYDVKNTALGENLLTRITHETGGKLIQTPEDVFKAEQVEVSGNTPLQNFILTIAIFLFIIDIAIRRFPFFVNRAEALFSKMLFKKAPIDKKKIIIENENSALKHDEYGSKPKIENAKTENDKPPQTPKSTSSLLLSKIKKRGGRQ